MYQMVTAMLVDVNKARVGNIYYFSASIVRMVDEVKSDTKGE